MVIQPVFRSVFSPVLQGVLGNPIGPAYVTAGRVLDYSTVVGPFTIVDQSDEGNNATLYSGRGIALDGASNLIDFGSPTFSEPVTSVTGQARSLDTSIKLGLCTATLEGNETWESFSADTPAKDYGDYMWFTDAGDYVSFPEVVLSGDWFFEYTSTAISSGDRIIGGTGSFLSTGGTPQIKTVEGGFITFSASNLTDNTTYRFTKTGGTIEMSKNGVPIQSRSIVSTDTLKFDKIGGINAANLAPSGVIHTVNFNDQATFVGDGTANSNWLDTSGNGKNGTVNGSPATVSEYYTNPDFVLGVGYDGDLSDVRCLGATGTVLGHWALSDWSDPTADGLNGKTVVDSGPNGFHGTCTGCSGFTGEGIDPVFTRVVGYDDKWYFPNDTVTYYKSASLTTDAHWCDVGSSFEIRLFPTSSQAGVHGILLATFGPSGTGRALSFDSSNKYLRLSSNGWTTGVNEVKFWNIDLDNLLNKWSTIRLEFVSGGVKGYLNGVLKGQQNWTSPESGLYNSCVIGGGLTNGTGYQGIIDYVSSNDIKFFTSGSTVHHRVSTVGQKRATIPQTADRNWNKGANLPFAEYTSTSDWDGDTQCTYTDETVEGEADSIKVTMDSSVDATHYIVSNSPSFVSGKVYKITGKYYIPAGQLVKRIQLDQGGYGKIVDLSSIGAWTNISHVFTATQPRPLRVYASDGNINIEGNPNGEYFALKDLAITEYIADWLVSESDADDQIDALGNPILEPRLNNQQLNFFGDGEYSSTPDSDSLDVTTEATWELWGNFYYVNTGTESHQYLSKFDGSPNRSWIINKGTESLVDEMRLVCSSTGNFPEQTISTISGIPDSVAQIVVTFNNGALKAYANGAEITIGTTTNNSIAVSPGTPVRIGAAFDGVLQTQNDRQIGSAKIYNVALSADEVLQNYNAQKSKYGL